MASKKTTKKSSTKGKTRVGQPSMSTEYVDDQTVQRSRLTKLEKQARREHSQSIRVAAFGNYSGGGGGGFSGYGNSGAGSITSADSQFYSPQLSTDFLELPQSEREKRELYRFWYNCFPPGTPILTSDGTTVPIEEIKIGDRVPNGFGELTTVVELFNCDIDDQIVELNMRGVQGTVRATGNHPFRIFRADQVDCKVSSITSACKGGENAICRRIKCESKDFGEPEYVYSKDIEVGDYIISPPLADTVDSGLSREELRLLGYYASEGSPAYRSAGVIRGVEFSLNITEANTVALEISDLFKEAFGKKARIYEYSERSVTKVVCDGVRFAEFCEQWVGRGSHDKKLDERLVRSTPDQALEFLGAYWNGDGCFTDNSYTANSVSGHMASQIFQMLRRLQIPAYHSRYDRPSRTYKGHTYPASVDHYVSFPGRYFDLFSKYANFVSGEYSASSTRVYLTHNDYGFLHRVESINNEPYCGPVHNFEVEGEGDKKSYIAHGLATHNTHPIVGAAIDFHCFPPGAPVMMRDGTVSPIESLNIGDEVINGFGEPTKVVQTFKHDISGPVTRLKVRGVQGDFDCTENHPFLVYRAEQVDCKFTESGIGSCEQDPKFVFANDLKEGDYICSPAVVNSEHVSDDYIRVGSNLLRRIEKVETVQYDGPVFNIEVDGVGDRKSYVAYGLATHNTDVPMSKIRLSLPKAKDKTLAKRILHFYQQMCKRVNLFQVLYDATHEYWLHGEVFLFCEDDDMVPEIPEDELYEETEEEVGEVDYAGRLERRRVRKKIPKSQEEREKIIYKIVQDKYQGWQRLQILPPEQVRLEVFQYTDKTQMELIPSQKDRMVVLRAEQQADREAARIANDIPETIKENLLNGQPIPLNTSPYEDFLCSSFCFHLSHKKSAYADRGNSILERCLRTLLFQDKLRQAQTSIASRAMTPKRVVWADKMSLPDVEDVRDQIDQALIDPDFTIITNFELHWDEIGSRDRLLDLSTEYEITNKLLFIGLRITESMLTGESTYSGERIHLDVMNTMYLLYRETVTTFVEEKLFAPVAEKKGFWEEDEAGNRILLYPSLKFTRLALRDNSELQDFMFNLYQKGSMPISYIYELLNMDVDDAHAELLKDFMTLKDSTMNELIREMLSSIGSDFVAETDAKKRIAENLGLKLEKEESDRFGKGEGD